MSLSNIPKHKYFATKALYEEQLAAGQINETDLCFIAETNDIITFGESFGGGVSINTPGTNPSINEDLLEGYIPLSRDFSDDFNNDFTR